MRDELMRRESNTANVISLFLRHPNQWLHWKRLAAIGGACAWRTRVSDARKFFKADGGALECNHRITRSAYRYVPPVPDRWPVYEAPTTNDDWRLI